MSSSLPGVLAQNNQLIINFIDDLRSHLCKNSLTLFKEMFSFEEFAEGFTDPVLLRLIKKCTFEKKFIANEAQEALKKLISIQQNPTFITKLAQILEQNK